MILSGGTRARQELCERDVGRARSFQHRTRRKVPVVLLPRLIGGLPAHKRRVARKAHGSVVVLVPVTEGDSVMSTA